jgi:cytidylate kinase
MSSDFSQLADFRASQWLLMERVRREQECETDFEPYDHERSTVTLSREYGAGGHTVAAKVAERLGPDWQIVDREIVDEVARSAKVRAQYVEGFDEHHPSHAEQLLRYLTNYWGLSPDKYYRHLVEVLLATGQRGRTIIIGRGANFVLPKALKVRLFASEPYRMTVIAHRDELGNSEALAKIHGIDKQRAAFVHAVFGKNIDNPADYDMVLRTDKMTTDAVAASICAAVNEYTHAVR